MATVGQTSLLGSMHLELNPPPGQPPARPLPPGPPSRLNKSSTYPSTEQTLASLSAVVNAGGLGQIGDIIHNFNAALSGRQDAVRDLHHPPRRLRGPFSTTSATPSSPPSNSSTGSPARWPDRRDVITEALRKMPPALDVLIAEKPRIITALNKLRTFSRHRHRRGQRHPGRSGQKPEKPATRPFARSPTSGPGIDDAIVERTVFPYGQNLIDRGLRGDYINLFAIGDITVPRLKKTLLSGHPVGRRRRTTGPRPRRPRL